MTVWKLKIGIKLCDWLTAQICLMWLPDWILAAEKTLAYAGLRIRHDIVLKFRSTVHSKIRTTALMIFLLLTTDRLIWASFPVWIIQKNENVSMSSLEQVNAGLVLQ